MQITLINILELLGTFVFAISGIRMAARKHLDWVGAYIVGLATAVGGGTLRDLLLDTQPFWMQDYSYFLTTAAALVAAIVFKQKIFKLTNTLFLFDAIGLGLFTVVGISKSIDAQLPFWACIIMGAITGSVGGVVRDVLLNEVPLLFRRDIYMLACVAGGIVYFSCRHLNMVSSITELLASLTVIFVRVVAMKFHVHLPTLKLVREE